MRPFLTASLLFLAGLTVFAQASTAQYVDVVFLFKGDPIEGTLLSYEYDKRVVLVQEDGAIRELPWSEVKRVNFRLDRTRTPETETEEEPAATPVVSEVLNTPSRKFRHQITSALTFGKSTRNDFNFPQSVTAIGGGIAYHLLRDISSVTVGAGLDVNLMNHQRQENVLAATVLAEVPIGRGRFRPFARMETGPTFPFGGGDNNDEITSRSVTVLYHPAVGVEITPRNGGWGKMTLDLGYRFLNSKFSLITENLDVVERNVNYRRLTLRGGMRF